MSILFVGAFNDINKNMSSSSSCAGSKVQLEIIKALNELCPEVKTLIMPEVQSWPKNKLFFKGSNQDGITFVPLLNFFLFKRFVFALYVFFYLWINNPYRVYFYNTNTSMNLLMYILRFIRRKQRKVLIIQDVHSPIRLRLTDVLKPRIVADYLGYKITRYSFDFFVPITQQVSDYLHLPKAKVYVWHGGITNFSNRVVSCSTCNFAVFAGALTKYNGVDLLLEFWAKRSDSISLHVFGVGELNQLAIEYSKQYENIKYHGFQPPSIVSEYVAKAKINFCFRFSSGISQEFFFPSKLFDILMEKGFVVCNKFKNMPHDLKPYLLLIEDDFSNFTDIIDECFQKEVIYIDERHSLLKSDYSWFKPIDYVEHNFI
ncbi:glycosyl transferase family 1 [Vibrio cholerae]|nr:hypothetical protein [Vibrio cholerae]GHX40368.1 glycosyl transferase family 1 [Vibrio cholerae]